MLGKQNHKCKLSSVWLLLLGAILLPVFVFAQPTNDHCTNASTIAVSNNGFGVGTFTSTVIDITSATVQTGETFAPAILVAGQSQKSVWFKFSISTTRSVRVTLDQSGTGITAGDVGFAVYKTSSCLPTNSQISPKLTPIALFGNTFHPCVEKGDYLVQVSSKAAANGKIVVKIETALPNAAYDQPSQAYDFGALSPGIKSVTYAVDCQSIEDATETCTALGNAQAYTKTSWHVFTTPSYFDYLALLFASTTGAFPSGQGKVGIKVYKGNARTTPLSGLSTVYDCDSLVSNGYTPDFKIFSCDMLKTNTVYSVQLFFQETFAADIRVAINLMGTEPTKAPQPVLSSMPASTILGILPSTPNGSVTTVSDNFGCNSRHSIHPCNPSLPMNGIAVNNYVYNLSAFYTFKLSTSSNLYFSTNGISCSGYYLFRVFKKAPTNDCKALDSTNFIGQWQNELYLSCLDPGEYTLQVMGRDSTLPKNHLNYGQLTNSPYPICMRSNLGEKFNVNIRANSVLGTSKSSLYKPGAVDLINAANGSLQPLKEGVTYTAVRDTFGCKPTVLPDDTWCSPSITQALYREFKIADSGVITLAGWNGYYNWNKIYAGDANALAASQNVYAYPERIKGLQPQTGCISWQGCWDNNVCLAPGTYTYTSFSDGRYGNSNVSEAPTFLFRRLETAHASLITAQNLGSIIDTMTKYGRTTIQSDIDYFSCRNNAVPINGYQPCHNYKKAIYRQFYLKEASLVNINGTIAQSCGVAYRGIMTLFSGKATDGVQALKPVGWPYECFTQVNPSTCSVLAPGWYTVVAYGTGSAYGETTQNGSGDVGSANQFTLSIRPGCPGPSYNRPHKAAVDTATRKPFLIEWKPNSGHTEEYPKTDVTYTLPTENFNCTVDSSYLPFCTNSLTKVAYYVFQTTQESYVQIDTKNLWGAVYAGNIRTDSLTMGGKAPVQSCSQSMGQIQICKLQPGYYTLVIFNDNNATCTNVTPTIYIDKVGYSRFDNAANAYDFGVVPADKAYHNGKVGDVNPLNASRAPSNDFIYCTTGAQKEDPNFPNCQGYYNPNIYKEGPNNALVLPGMQVPYGALPRRNLWYTFVVKDGGNVKVRIETKTPGKGYPYSFAIYQSDVDGSLPFSQVVQSGQVDSTIFQGLTLVRNNFVNDYCYHAPREISFYREPCSPKPQRYYILVDNANSYPTDIPGVKPNSQLEVSVSVDPVAAIQPKFDHYTTAGNIGSALGVGTYKGPTDNYSCATRDPKDPIYSNYACGTKTLWYKFTTTVTGHVRFRIVTTTGTTPQSLYSWTDVSLYRVIKPGDSTSNGLAFLNGSNAYYYDPQTPAYWGSQCISPGTYYLLLTGCGKVNEDVYPEIKIDEEAGDFCSAPVVAALNSPGAKMASATIDCHTIGTDYGEFNPTLTCPNGVPKEKYKTTWYRIDITGKDTLDVTTYINENTNAQSSEIKYRMMTGNCGAMQEQSCVEDALTRNTYKCLAPGSYYLQVFTPISPSGQPSLPVTGTIDLHLSAVKHVDTCATFNNCLSNATFVAEFDCTKDDAVSFVNYSTYGSNIQYKWDFGVGGQTSTEVAPRFSFPALATAKTYTVKLTVTNTSCNGTSTYSLPVTVPGRPAVSLGSDTTLCTYGTSLTLNAGTWSGTTYQWSTGETTPSINVSRASATANPYWVQATYNGCIRRDTIQVAINPITKQKQSHYLCGEDSVQLNSARGFGESYLWNTGATTTAVFVKSDGLYLNQVKWNGCMITDSFTVLKPPPPFEKKDTVVCAPFRSFTLNATSPGAQSYQWQNGAGGATQNVTTPGTYWVKVNYPNCSLRDTLIITQSPAVLQTTKDTTICSGKTYQTQWGQLLTQPGTYRDTIRYNGGCDSLVQTVNLKVVTTQTSTINASVCGGGTYTLPWGEVVDRAGIYRDTLRSSGGCDSLLRVVNLQVNQPVVNSTSAAICQGQNFTLPWGKVVTTAGIYRDTLRHVAGCDSLIRIVELKVNSSLLQVSEAVICEGNTYTLPWGEVVTQSGRYLDVIRYASGCDSLVREVTLRVTAKEVQDVVASICEGGRYRLPWGPEVSTAGIYRDTVRTAAGCDSLIRSVDLAVSTVAKLTQTVPLCEGSTYTLPSGVVVQGTGTFVDTLRAVNGGCDSVIRTINVTAQTKVTNRSNASICAGATYTLPWGEKVYTAGTYRDTVRYVSGCDSLIQEVNLQVNAALTTTTDAGICSGEQYTLPWGGVVTTAGVYKDTIRYADGCDSLIQTVTLSVRSLTLTSTAASICSGETYSLPWGGTVSISGMYSDTLRYVAGCDSVIQRVELTVREPQTNAFSVSLCSGQTYTLPSGEIVSIAGVHKDTLRYQAGCDSVYRSITVLVNTPVVLDLAVSICEGSGYTLPSGTIVTAAGVYRDTVRQSAGCDSLYRTINLRIRTTQTKRTTASICDGESYVLPWGGTASISGIFRDTLRYTEGCDSLIQVVELVVNKATRFSDKATICEGSTYTLPWGTSVSTAGIYRDTLRYATGCDSLIRQVDLLVNQAAVEQELIARCKGESFTLPWGPTVSESGTYRDTLRYTSGCDSVRRSYVVSFGAALTTTEKPAICAGELYTLPWGPQVNAAGSYRDTLRTRAGCDSLIRIVDLQVKDVTTQHLTATICQGGSYTLPGGQVVSHAGTYRDTLHFVSGCDSIRRSITLRVEEPTTLRQTAVICGGDSYNLPWGPAVNTQGIYRDTLRYASGCDSVVREVDLVVLSKRVQASSAVVCEGQSYTLPWGERVTSSGIYQDTLHYQKGCDSLIRVVTVTVQKATTQALSPTICSGHSYTLPWGQAATTSGIYRDTLQYQSGCDSVIRVVNLTVTAPEVSTVSASICSDQWYTLPSGTQVNTTGVYRDTLRTSAGCDSLLRTVNLEVRQAPVLTLSKSNDVDCMLGTARLQASGASSYTWSPATSLSNASISNPVASPTSTTVYSVKASATNGCSVDGSIEVKVTKGNPGKGYPVPTAFTPNGDGKNDCFSVRHWGVVQNFKMMVYNRWGEIVFQSTDVSRCWDGVYKSQREGSATFVYVITADTNCGQVLRKGYVNLIR